MIHRLDGFISADAPYNGGWLVTPPLVFQWNRLQLNINVAAMGMALVEIQDKQGVPIFGFLLDDCDRIWFNDVAYTVKWQGKSNVSSLAGQPIRLRIAMFATLIGYCVNRRSAKLYDFQFV